MANRLSRLILNAGGRAKARGRIYSYDLPVGGTGMDEGNGEEAAPRPQRKRRAKPKPKKASPDEILGRLASKALSGVVNVASDGSSGVAGAGGLDINAQKAWLAGQEGVSGVIPIGALPPQVASAFEQVWGGPVMGIPTDQLDDEETNLLRTLVGAGLRMRQSKYPGG